jgi:hypothetical protein
MLAHGKNIEWLCCCQGPVAYAHRQRSVALRAEIGRSQAVWGCATVLWLIDQRVNGCLVLARRAAHGLPVCVSHRNWEITPAPPKPGGRHLGDLVILEAELVFAKHYRYLTAND